MSNEIKTKVFDISLVRISQAFHNMEFIAKWDISKNLYWGFYFLDSDLDKLQIFGNRLKEQNYTVVELREVEDTDLFLLHVEKKKVHSSQSLFDECNNLANLAIERKIEIFDGWDVEKESLSKGLVE